MAGPEIECDMSLDRLPRELLHRICVATRHSDIPSLRLVCKAVCVVADEHLVPTREVSCYRQGISSTLRPDRVKFLKGMTTLRVDGTRLQHHGDYDHWYHVRRPHLPAYRHSPTYQSLDNSLARQALEAHMAYMKLYEDEANFATECTFRKDLCALMKLIPRLKKVVVGGLQGPMYNARGKRAYGDAMVVPSVDATNDNEALTMTLLAAYDARIKIKRLIAFSVDTARYLGEFGEVLSELEHIWLDLSSPHHIRDVVSESQRARNLAHFLVQCRQARALEIHFPYKTWMDEESLWWEITPQANFTGSFVFPNLTWLRLDKSLSTQNTLQNFLLGHRMTLRKVILHELDLVDGHWGDLFEAISGQFPLMKGSTDQACFRLSGMFSGFGFDGGITLNQWEFTAEREPDDYTKGVQDCIREGGTLPELPLDRDLSQNWSNTRNWAPDLGWEEWEDAFRNN